MVLYRNQCRWGESGGRGGGFPAHTLPYVHIVSAPLIPLKTTYNRKKHTYKNTHNSQQLDLQLDSITRKVQHANKAYLQHVPKDLPPPATPQRLVTALPLVWPDVPEELVKQRLDEGIGGGLGGRGGRGVGGMGAAAATGNGQVCVGGWEVL